MKRNWLLQFAQSHRQWIPSLVLIGTLGLTALATGYVKNTAEDKDQIRFQNAVQRTENSVESQLETYIALLRGSAGLFSAEGAVSRERFRAYVNQLMLQKHYPGIQGIGFAKQFRASERPNIPATLRVKGLRNFAISPTFARSVYYPIIYLEPLDRRNQAAMGFDMFTEPVRRAAMERARDDGLAAATGKVMLRQEIDQRKQAGFLIYVPIYQGGSIPTTLAERRAKLEGFVYSAFRANDLMAGIFGAEPYPRVSFQIYDGTTPSPKSLLYSSRSHDGADEANYRPRFTTALTTSIAGRPWTIVYATKPFFDETSSIVLVPYVAMAGTIVSFLLFGITRSQAKARIAAEQLTAQLRQSEYNLQRSHDKLESRVASRTAELSRTNTVLQEQITAKEQAQNALEQTDRSLQQALAFTEMLKEITDRVRDSLDETQILQTAVEALAIGLGAMMCNTGLYNLDQGTSKITAEFTVRAESTLGQTVRMADFPERYQSLLAGQNLQFCSPPSVLMRDAVSVLACPVFDDQGLLGDIWLFRSSVLEFSAIEVHLVEQVATQCAIALRQARLYEAAQAQVKALEKVNWLKDDFLSTVSHELRTPVSNMKLAIRMLELALSNLENLDSARPKAQQYLQILQAECQREINLINDLLDLQRLVSGKQATDIQTVNLLTWLPQLVEPFQERAKSRDQMLQLEMPPQDLLPLVTDVAALERILNELLNNACKYTPPHETIKISAHSQPGTAQFAVCNSGVEIPEQEQSLIFEKFYRIPNADPWQQGGTGLGLALTKRLAEHLGGSIQVESIQGTTTFTVAIPNQGVRDRVQETV